MNDKPVKPKLPAYISFSAFITLINILREVGIPLKIDRSVMSKASGSQYSAMVASLRFLSLVDESDKPTPKMKELVEANDETRGEMFRSITKESYSFLLDDPEFHLDRATGNQVAAKFREQEISGSTVTKSIAFFISICQAAGMKVSSHVKPPPPPRGAAKKAPKSSKRDAQSSVLDHDEDSEDEDDDGDVERFEIPIPGKTSVRVIVPSDLDADDWEMLQSMISVYIKRWKGFKNSGGNG